MLVIAKGSDGRAKVEKGFERSDVSPLLSLVQIYVSNLHTPVQMWTSKEGESRVDAL